MSDDAYETVGRRKKVHSAVSSCSLVREDVLSAIPRTEGRCEKDDDDLDAD